MAGRGPHKATHIVWPPVEDAPLIFRILAPVALGLEKILQKGYVTGLENIPATGPAIIVPNHTTQLDALTVAATLYRARRGAYFAAGSDFFGVPVLGEVLKAARAVPVYHQKDRAAGSLDGVREAIRDGKCIVVFPEGAFTRDPDLWPMRGKTGVARMALEFPHVPVIPLAHWGNDRIIHPWSKKIAWRKIGRIRNDVSVGEPIDFTAYHGHEVTYELITEMTTVMMSALTELMVPLRRRNPQGMSTTPPKKFWDRRVDGDPMAEWTRRNETKRRRMMKLWRKVTSHIPFLERIGKKPEKRKKP